MNSRGRKRMTEGESNGAAALDESVIGERIVREFTN